MVSAVILTLFSPAICSAGPREDGRGCLGGQSYSGVIVSGVRDLRLHSESISLEHWQTVVIWLGRSIVVAVECPSIIPWFCG